MSSNLLLNQVHSITILCFILTRRALFAIAKTALPYGKTAVFMKICWIASNYPQSWQ